MIGIKLNRFQCFCLPAAKHNQSGEGGGPGRSSWVVTVRGQRAHILQAAHTHTEPEGSSCKLPLIHSRDIIMLVLHTCNRWSWWCWYRTTLLTWEVTWGGHRGGAAETRSTHIIDYNFKNTEHKIHGKQSAQGGDSFWAVIKVKLPTNLPHVHLYTEFVVDSVFLSHCEGHGQQDLFHFTESEEKHNVPVPL